MDPIMLDEITGCIEKATQKTISALTPPVSNFRLFTTDGIFTVPEGVGVVYVSLGGGCGGGAGGQAGSSRTMNDTISGIPGSGGGGGDAGDVELFVPVRVTAGEQIVITIGKGGLGGSGGVYSAAASTYAPEGENGKAGGTTSFGNKVSVNGGGGGRTNANNSPKGGNGGDGGTGVAGDGGSGGNSGYGWRNGSNYSSNGSQGGGGKSKAVPITTMLPIRIAGERGTNGSVPMNPSGSNHGATSGYGGYGGIMGELLREIKGFGNLPSLCGGKGGNGGDCYRWSSDAYVSGRSGSTGGKGSNGFLVVSW